MTDSHRCLAGDNCCAATYTAGKRIPALTETQDTLCEACLQRIESAVQQLPKDWANLRDALGERAAAGGQRISSTPAPAIPISTRKEALMRAIVDMADRAAAIVSDALNTDQPVAYKGRGHPEQAERLLRAAVAITAPNIGLLAAAPTEHMLVWAKPMRCPVHAELIALAEAGQVDPGPAYVLAGQCDDCNGWGEWGQEREHTEMSGIHVALELVELHNQARAELGLTRLRHKYEMPCPNCGADVGRDDGTAIVDCRNCESSWTEGEYQFLVGLITRERLDMKITEYLLAEAYARLDEVQKRLDVLRFANEDSVLDEPGAGRIIADAMEAAIAGHKRPNERTITTDRAATEQRQTAWDKQTFRNETPYKPPKRKPLPERQPVKNPIHPASLLNVIDIDADAVLNGDARCEDCNMIHAGECA
ncbi:hypothetical protein [Mycobacterium colombiense]